MMQQVIRELKLWIGKDLRPTFTGSLPNDYMVCDIVVAEGKITACVQCTPGLGSAPVTFKAIRGDTPFEQGSSIFLGSVVFPLDDGEAIWHVFDLNQPTPSPSEEG